MKKTITILLAVAMALVCFAACSSSDEEENTSAQTELTDNGDGTLTCLDTANSPLDGGLMITVDTNAGTVNMQITDTSGNETVEYYLFTPAEGTCERYRYVSAMGTGYYYTFDIDGETISAIINLDGEDVTQSTIDSGRYDSAVTETQEYVSSLISYFESTFGMTLSEALQ